MPFFEQDRAKKKEMLKRMGIDLDITPSKRCSHASTLAKLAEAKVLKTIPRGDGFWYRGENWESFLTFLVTTMMSDKRNRIKFADMLVKYETNSLDFIMKD